MSILIAGLIIFLGLHSVRIVADGWRTQKLVQWGEGAWKGAYSVVSLVGFVMICWGYGHLGLGRTELGKTERAYVAAILG
jgi:uncharacterized membrane protein